MKRFLGAMVALACGLGTSSALAQSTVFALDVRAAPNAFISFPLATPGYNLIGPTTPDIFAMDFDNTGTTLYAITFGAAIMPELGTINTATGVYAPIAALSGGGAIVGTNVVGMKMDPTSGTMYICLNNSIATINLATAAVTLVAPIVVSPPPPVVPLWIDIAIDNSGNMFGHDIGTDAMYSINKTTGAGTLLGPTGFLANFAQGMDFDPASNVLYATIYTGGGTGAFASVNTTTGAATLIVNTQPWVVNGPEMEMAIKGAAVVCYPDCNLDTFLTVADFGCFQTRFILNDPYADCNLDTLFTVADFGCFQTKFIIGCP
jgi:hypothetical protein